MCICSCNIFFPINREQLNKILCVFFDKADQYKACIQSNDNGKVGVAKQLWRLLYQAHVIQFISVAEGLIHSVQFLCQLLSTIEPLAIIEAVNDLKRTTLLLMNTTRDSRWSEIFSPSLDMEVCHSFIVLLGYC